MVRVRYCIVSDLYGGCGFYFIFLIWRLEIMCELDFILFCSLIRDVGFFWYLGFLGVFYLGNYFLFYWFLRFCRIIFVLGSVVGGMLGFCFRFIDFFEVFILDYFFVVFEVSLLFIFFLYIF